MKKKYSAPRLNELTPEQAHEIIAEKKKITEEEAAELLKQLREAKERELPPPNKEHPNHKKSA